MLTSPTYKPSLSFDFFYILCALGLEVKILIVSHFSEPDNFYPGLEVCTDSTGEPPIFLTEP